MYKLPEISVEDIFENKLSFLNKTQDYLYSRYFIVKKNPYCNFLVNDSIKDTWLYLLEHGNFYPDYFTPIDILVDILSFKYNNKLFYYCTDKTVYSKSMYWLNKFISKDEFIKLKNMKRQEAIWYLTKKSKFNNIKSGLTKLINVLLYE